MAKNHDGFYNYLIIIAKYFWHEIRNSYPD